MPYFFRCTIFVISLFFVTPFFAKEWKSLHQYQKETGEIELSLSDWLKKDRVKNTVVWQEANAHNLTHNLYNEYQTIRERRDFYLWYYKEIDAKGHEVVWPKMAHFISKKLRLTMAFPYKVFLRKSVKAYSKKGSKTVFDNAFLEMKRLLYSENVLTGTLALNWDKAILKKEQFEWLVPVYKTVDEKTKKTITNIAKGHCFYGFLVPKPIRFKGDLSSTTERYNYALNDLREYCKIHYK
ncbi:Insecticidal toxin complex protein [Mangrovimonas spongiae]|uniref:Insecticidal toxin complex protein n=1 Tax=Mangrovimonas spongiae TaxID=2494697 RepID=UPI001F0CB121|nr:Insecticidal toxin complex protein [Mangrovimonas spongiae]